MLAMAGLPAPGGACVRPAVRAKRQPAHSRRAAAAAAELEAMGVEEAYEEEDAVDVDAMTYEELLALGDAAGHVSRGCSAALIAALPSSEYSAAAHAAAGGAEQCAVCRLEYEVGDVTTTLPCKHYFHAECLAPWLRANKTCICCKRELPGASPAHAARRAAV
jgi:E3 ubiquitin-protein ligase BIG BROTHER-like protein